MEVQQRENKRRQNLRRGALAVVAAALIIGSAALFFQKSSPATVVIPTTTSTAATTSTTVGLTSATCSPTPFAVTGFASIPCAAPAGTFGKAPTMVIPTTAPPAVLEAADLIKGTGVPLKLGDTIKAQYVLADYATHKDLQSSWPKGFATPFKTGALIAGWTKGLVGMRPGGRRELIIPASLGYGAGGQGIPANDTLVFIVDLLKIS